MRGLILVAFSIASASGRVSLTKGIPGQPLGIGPRFQEPKPPEYDPETGALIIRRCDGEHRYFDMSGPTPVGDGSPSAWSDCLQRHADGVPGDRLGAAIDDAFEHCFVFAPAGEVAAEGLYAGEYCLMTDVYYYVTVNGVRTLKWEGWAGHVCD